MWRTCTAEACRRWHLIPPPLPSSQKNLFDAPDLDKNDDGWFSHIIDKILLIVGLLCANVRTSTGEMYIFKSDIFGLFILQLPRTTFFFFVVDQIHFSAFTNYIYKLWQTILYL